MTINLIESPGNKGGDKIEKLGWPLFGKDKFPNYEVFWQNFVVPRTNRNQDIHIASDTAQKDREIASIHYAIFHSFYVIYYWLASKVQSVEDEDKFFEYSSMKLSNVCDLVEELLFKLLIATGNLDENDLLIQSAFQKPALNKKIAEIKKLTPEKVMNDLQLSGTSSIRITNRTNIISKKFSLKPYLSQSGGIRAYRNVIVHSWQSFKIDNNVPKISYVKKYQDWLLVTDMVKSNDTQAKLKMVEDEFIPMRTLIAEQADKLIAVVNELWAEAVPIIPPYTRQQPLTPNTKMSLIGDSPRATMSGMISTSSNHQSGGQ